MTTHEPILARLAALKAMSVNELKTEWQALYDAPAPNNSRNFLEGRLAYRIQELTYGGPDKQARRLLGSGLIASRLRVPRERWPTGRPLDICHIALPPAASPSTCRT